MMASLQRIHAMKEAHVEVAVVCQAKNYVVMGNGLVLPIYGWLDEDHRPTDDLEIAMYYEFGNEEFGFGVGNIDAYEMPSYMDH
jgi:hypothetical protein